ncbi:helix-turn-helix transcriptional regulator [Kribbella sandramycini]|uniref:Helix-turn-helix transcriptional regulator n=1 Tax=Kribbella sandramycini TaxID=60450 RepID=A0A7Y4L4R0_9ACTN|nr:transcriptional regulator with XRE-family HTH domain [Kribbella sandramycini]NOL43406.1 helix-turn-helix transcriptional regulator [Kribbella sandramycini]
MAETRTETTTRTSRLADQPADRTVGGGGEPAGGFGAELRRSRQAAGLSLRRLAGRVGYDHSYLSQVERGQRPGSADLARRCDRELGTADRLATAFASSPARSRAKPAPAPRPGGAPDLMQATWEWVAGSLAGLVEPVPFPDRRTIPPARLLPELLSELRRVDPSASGSEPHAAELCALIAETLTDLGRATETQRWWRAARSLAAASGAGRLEGLMLVREAISGLVEQRPPAALLELTAAALTLADPARPELLLRAHAVQAELLVAMGRPAAAHLSLQAALRAGSALPSATTDEHAPSDALAVEGRACVALGYWDAGCLFLQRALTLCPAGWLAEQAGLQMSIAECLALSGDGAAALAQAMRSLVELPDEWHTASLYAAAERVLSTVRTQEPQLTAVWSLHALLERRAYQGRSVGVSSSPGGGWG